ncbi:MAG: TldD/PmbA family protein [Proteobacteria bacterium]|nr:TldD/PmbA family protein [Pseudomonadota bacterium]
MTQSSDAEAHTLAFLSDLVARAIKAGAHAADAIAAESVSLAVSQRLGKHEDLERSEAVDLSLRVLLGKRQAMVSSTDRSDAAVEELVTRAVAMARIAPEDPHIGLADPALIAKTWPELDLVDTHEADPDELYARTAKAEDAARAVAGVTNSEGADASWGRSTVALVTSGGFAAAYSGTSHSVSASVIAGEGTGMERDYDYSAVRFAKDLDDPTLVGRRAGERAVRRLNPRKVNSAAVPVILDPRVSNGLLRHVASAINGAAVARGTSFLRDKLNEKIFADGIVIVDDPHRKTGMASRPFDGEGVANRRMNIVEDGVLTTWLLDTATGHQLGMATTGHASRGASSPPSPSTTNLYMEPGTMSPSELMADIAEGFYVTELIGFGVNGVTGDYSRGAAGYWIENGALTFPVSELTIAGNLKTMFLNVTPANDLEFRYGTNAPTIRIEGLTVAGA